MTPPYTPNRRALSQQLEAHGLNKHAVFEALDSPGVYRGLSGQEAVVALAAVINERDPWEYIWAHISPTPFVLNRFKFVFAWHIVEWSDDDWAWVPEDTGADDEFDTFQSLVPDSAPKVPREAVVGGEVDHTAGIERTITGVEREEVPPLFAELIRTTHGKERAAPRVWLQPDDVGDKYHATYDTVVWNGDMFGLVGEWESVDRLNDQRRAQSE